MVKDNLNLNHAHNRNADIIWSDDHKPRQRPRRTYQREPDHRLSLGAKGAPNPELVIEQFSSIDASVNKETRLDAVIRHPKERRSKCSLTPLEARDDLAFYKAREGWEFDATGYTILALDAPVLSREDGGRPLLLLDSTWRLLPQVEACLSGEAVRRTLPPVATAYPRISKIAQDPMGGLASVEALYLARLLIGRRDDRLLAAYYWRDSFLENLKNAGILPEY